MRWTNHNHSIKKDLFYFLSQNKMFVTLVCLLSLGVLIGSILAQKGTDKTQSILELIASGFVDKRTNQGFFQTFAGSFFSSLSILVIGYILGLCAVAAPAIFFLPIFKGLGLGLSISFLYQSYGFRGFGIVMALIIPNAVFSSLVLILACRESFQMSSMLCSSLRAKKDAPPDLNGLFKLYSLRYAFYGLLLLLCAALDALSTWIFSGLL